MPKKNLKIIGAGFGRTGTNSLKLALEQLGFDPCHHMIEVFKNPSQVALWVDAANHKLADWESIFKDYQAMVDFPGSLYYKELMSAYPDAKVLLSVRDSEHWYDSSFETIYQLSTVVPKRFWPFIPRMGKMFQMVDQLIWQGLFAGKFSDKQQAIEIFERWNEEVKTYVPADKLLIFDVRDGWQPLCEFLGVAVPKMAFPHLNDRNAMLRRIMVLRFVTRVLPLLVLGLMVILAFRFW
jgi:hypothetical protein